MKNGAEVIYQSPNAKSIFYTETLLQPNKSLGNKIDKEIIPKIQKKFKFDEAKARDLAQWHKDSDPLTKDEQGLPKVFYHGSGDYGFEEFKYGNDELGKQGFYFSSSKEVANTYNVWDENPIYGVF